MDGYIREVQFKTGVQKLSCGEARRSHTDVHAVNRAATTTSRTGHGNWRTKPEDEAARKKKSVFVRGKFYNCV